MPPRTSAGKRPVIVYLSEEDEAEIQRRAEQQDTSVSNVARGLIREALARAGA